LTLKPKVFLIENVKGLITHNNGETFKFVMEKILNKYQINHKVLNSFDYEVPQKRERIFIIGMLEKKYEFPTISDKKIMLKHVLIDVPKSDCARYSQKKIDLFKQIKQGECWVNISDEQQREYLGKSYFSGGGKRGILRRLSMDEPCLTLLCSPSQKQTERCHPIEERPLSLREYARIQTFDDEYKFYGSISSQYKQIGNAVPVKLAEFIGLSLMNQCDIIS